MKKFGKVLLLCSIFFGLAFASVSLTSCDLFKKDKGNEGDNPTQEHTHAYESSTKEENGVYTITKTCSCGDTKSESYDVFKATLLKTSYVEGQYVEYTDFDVKILNKTTLAYDVLDDFAFTLEGKALVTSDNKVTVSYEKESKTYSKEFSFTVNAITSSIKGIDVLVEPGLVLTSSTVLSESFLYRESYTDGTFSEYYPLAASELAISVSNPNINIVVTKNLYGTEYQQTLRLTNKVTNVEFTKPNKLIYATGDTLDLTGAQAVVTYAYGEAETKVITTDMLSCETCTNFDLSVGGDYTITMSVAGASSEFTIIVRKGVQSIELVSQVDESELYLGCSNAEVAAKFAANALKVTYVDSTEETISITEDMLSHAEFVEGVNTYTVEFLTKTTTFTLTLGFQGKTVADALAISEATTDYYYGTVMGYNYEYVPNSDDARFYEVVIRDYKTSQWINVYGISEKPVAGTVISFKGTSKVGYGDRICMTYVSDYRELFTTTDYKLDLSKAITIADDATFKATFADDNRANTYTQLYKLHGNISGITYYTSTYRIFFPGVTTYGYGEGKQYFNSSLSGVMRSYMVEENTSYTINDLFGSTTNYSQSKKADKDIYVIYCGSQSGSIYYGNFVILGDWCIVDMEPVVKSYSYDLDQLLSVGEDYDLVGKKVTINYVYNKEPDEYTLTAADIVVPENFDKNVAGEYNFDIKVNGVKAGVVKITYAEALCDSIELDNTSEFTLANDLNGGGIDLTKLHLKAVYGVDKEDVTVTSKMITPSNTPAYIDADGRLNKEFVITYMGKTCIFTTLVGKTVEEALTADNISGGFFGIYVGINSYGNNASSIANFELVLKSYTSDSLICVRTTDYKNLVAGDIVVVTGKTATSYLRRYIQATTDTVTGKALTITDTSKIQLDLSKATTFTNHTDFKAAFDTDAERTEMMYKIVHFAANTITATWSYDNIGRLYMAGITKTGTGETGQYFVSSLSPCINNNVTQMNTGITAKSILNSSGFAFDAESTVKNSTDLYFVFLGNSGVYYANFVILGTYMMVEVA